MSLQETELSGIRNRLVSQLIHDGQSDCINGVCSAMPDPIDSLEVMFSNVVDLDIVTTAYYSLNQPS